MCTPRKCTTLSPTTKQHQRTPSNMLRRVAAAKLTRSKYPWPFHHRPKIHSPDNADLPVCHLEESTCVARRVTDVSIQLATSSLVSRPNTLRRMSPEAVTPPRFHTQLEGQPSKFQFQRYELLVQPVANVLTLSAVTQKTVRFNMDVVEHCSEHVKEHSNEKAAHAEKQHHVEQEPIHVLTIRSPLH